jgi:hypothetical protein
VPKGSRIQRSLQSRRATHLTVVSALVALLAGAFASTYHEPGSAGCPFLAARFETVHRPTVVIQMCTVSPGVGAAIALRFDVQVRVALVSPIDDIREGDR